MISTLSRIYCRSFSSFREGVCRRRLRRLRPNKTIETLGTTQQVVTFQGDKTIETLGTT